jgi:ubiquinol-cytochrome c reductase iron-sulfur subunit
MPGGDDEQEREPLRSTDEDRRAFVADFEAGEHVLVRRRLMLALAGSSLVVGAVAALFPFRSLGPRPGSSLRRTAWTPGRRLVDESGRPIRAADLGDGSAVTVFPEGVSTSDTSADRASSQAVLIRVAGEPIRPPGRRDWTVDGCVAYSRICTHAGCPVGLYEADVHKLVCPCHQSLFDVLDGARPEFGPATRALPQLPLAVDRSGYLVAQSDFHEPVGPSYWNR